MRIFLLLILILGVANAQEPITVVSRVTTVSIVPDAKKLEARAVAVLRKRSKLTLQEARDYLRKDNGGQIDVDACMQYLIEYQVSLITQADVKSTRVERVLAEPQRPGD